jgi:hypothetical protein
MENRGANSLYPFDSVQIFVNLPVYFMKIEMLICCFVCFLVGGIIVVVIGIGLVCLGVWLKWGRSCDRYVGNIFGEVIHRVGCRDGYRVPNVAGRSVVFSASSGEPRIVDPLRVGELHSFLQVPLHLHED